MCALLPLLLLPPTSLPFRLPTGLDALPPTHCPSACCPAAGLPTLPSAARRA